MNMNRRRFIQTSSVGAVAAGVMPQILFAEQTGGHKPNVVILFIDDLGYGDVGAFGCPDIPTPHIDSLAETGVKCTWSYITNPPCSPSRCCLMTGMYTQRFGKAGMGRGIPIPEDHPTMAEFMRDAGYVTGMVGRWDIGKSQGPLARGFQEVACIPPRPGGKSKGPSYHCIDRNGKEAYLTDIQGNYLAEFVDRNKDKPFFLYFAPLGIHVPVTHAPEKHRRRAPKASSKRKAIAGSLIAVDDAIGKLLVKLKEHGLEKDTLILFTGDNGGDPKAACRSHPFRGGKGKGTQQEGWVHTPTIVSGPGTLPTGTTFNGMMCTMDFYATAAAVAGKPLPERCEGKDLLPFLKGKKTGDVHEELYWYNAEPSDPKHRHLQAMRWKQWRLLKQNGGNQWHLFDMHKDPAEKKDLAGAHPDILKDMKKRHAAWVAKLPPVRTPNEFKNYKGVGGGEPPRGWGWATAKGHPKLPMTPAPRKKP